MMRDLQQGVTPDGDTIVLRSDGMRWEVLRRSAEGKVLWRETSVSGATPFTEAEAKAEFERWLGDKGI